MKEIEALHYSKLTPYQRRVLRNKYVEAQNNKCYHCGGSLNEPTPASHDKPLNMKLFPEGFLNWPVHLHHSHVTDLTIGAVHAKCNGILWQYYGE